MREIVYDLEGVPVELGDSIGRGGEAEVFCLQRRSNILVKWYHPEVLQKRGSELYEKIEAMRKIEALRKVKSLSWPLIQVYRDAQRRNWIGFAMYRAHGVPIFKMAHPMLYKRYFPQIDRHHLILYLIDLIDKIKLLHGSGVMIGDYNLQNILCATNNEQVMLIDCDSYQISISGRMYHCPVGSADMTPPEHQKKAFTTLKRTRESEAFSVAILLFKALMLGRHPYDIVGGNDPVSNLCRGDFPYGQEDSWKKIPKGSWYNIWSHMPYNLKSLFIKTFTEGALDPTLRPTIEDWGKALEKYLFELERGYHSNEIRPGKPKKPGLKQINV